MKPEDGPWISLPSKQYPNEVYYFNVSTGMSDWEKPKRFCEPVSDSTNLQCLAKPTTPERTKNSSYIVESLSPSSSPKKLLQNVNKPTPEIQQKEGREKRKRIILQRNRSQIKEHLSRKCVDVKKKPTKDANEAKCKPDRNSKSDLFQPVPKLPKPNNEIINKTAVEDRLQSAERKSCDSGVTSQKSSHSGQSNEKFPQETMWEQRKNKDSQNPDLVRGRCETVLRRCKVPDVPVVCGAASERLERLKKQLREDRLKKCQRPQTEWPENSSEKEWQTDLLKQRNRVVEEIRHYDVPSFSSSSDLRKKYFSVLGNESLRTRYVDSFPSRCYTQSSSGFLSKPYLSEDYGKPYFIRDYYHTKSYNDNTLLRRKYFESMPGAIGNDQLKLQPSLLLNKPYNKALEGNYGLPNFDKKGFFSNSFYQSGSPSMSTSNLLQKYYVPDKEFSRAIVDRKRYYLPVSERQFFPKLEISSLSRTNPVNQLVKQSQVLPGEPYNKTGLLKDRVHSFEHEKSLPGSYISKPSAMDRLRPYKLLLQANELRNQHPGNYSHSKLKSNIGPFTSTSDAFFSGRKCDNESSRNIRTDSSFDVQQRKPVESVCYNMPSNYTTSLRNEKAIETGCKGTEVISSWEWSSQGFVREYNHKSITDNGQQSADTYEKCISRGKVMGSTSEKTMRGRINTHGDSAISALPNKSSQLGHLSCYPGRNVERLFLPRKSSQPGCSVAKNFEQNESELEKRVKNEIGNKKIGSNVDYHLSYSNSNPNTSEQSKNSLINNTFLRDKLKQKSHNSKGGITKINRRVQKQVRTAAPKLIHLPSSSVRNILESSQKSKSVDPNCTSVHPVKLIEEEEEMDWEPIEPEKVVMHVEALRKEGGFQNIVNPELVNLCNMDNEMSSQWFVVLDTNVLLSHLAFLRGLRDTKDTELGMPTLFIPWVVLQELDHLKSTNKKAALQNYARRAINFIYDNLLNKHPRVGGQPKAEADEYDALEPDDSILQCSLNLQKRSSKVLLLTNDRNLFNKAIVNGVECCSALKLLQELETRRKLSTPSTSSFGILDDSKLPFHTTVQTVKQCIGVVLEELLRTEMVLVYDRDWSEIVSRKPPWTLNDILFCISKHWVAVFRLVLPSAARELIEKIRTFVNNEVYETSLESVKNLVKTCISLMHLVSSLSYKQYVDNALKTLNELQCSLKVHTKLPTPSCVTHSSAATGTANNALSIISGTSQLDDSDATSVTSKGEKHTQSIGIGIDSREDCDGGNSIDDSKIDADDCLSLFASTFSEDTGNTHLSDGSVEKGQELTHKYLNKIWEKIAVYCGMLCDVMGVEPCVPYQLPEPFPAVETLHRNMLSFVKCVSTLLRCMEGILLSQPTELRETSPIILNFYNTIKESLPIWNELGEALLPQHVLAYCTQTDTRQQLDHGKNQFEQFEAVLNRAVTFFMGQNQSLTSLPSF